MRSMMAKLKLTVNETKTRLSVSFRTMRLTSWGTRLATLLPIIAREQLTPGGLACAEEEDRQALRRDSGSRRPNVGITWTKREMVGPAERKTARLGRAISIWAQWAEGTTLRVNYHVTNRLRRWLCRKHKVRGPGYSRYPDRYLYQKLSLYRLSRTGRRFPRAAPCEDRLAKRPRREPDALIGHVGSLSGMWKRSMV